MDWAKTKLQNLPLLSVGKNSSANGLEFCHAHPCCHSTIPGLRQ
jgi:hypothetical protein